MKIKAITKDEKSHFKGMFEFVFRMRHPDWKHSSTLDSTVQIVVDSVADWFSQKNGADKFDTLQSFIRANIMNQMENSHDFCDDFSSVGSDVFDQWVKGFRTINRI